MCQIKKVFYLFFLKKYKSILRNFKQTIEIQLNIDIEEKMFYHNMFFYYCYEKTIYKKTYNIIQKINPKCFVEIYTPNRQLAVINTICHKLKIPVIDLQHGAIFEFEPIMYSYYLKKEYFHLSNYIFTFGQYWNQKKNLHLHKDKVISVGFPYLENHVNKTLNRDLPKTKILIISQTRYHKMFIDLAKYIKENTSYDVELKTHPYEHAYYKNGAYDALMEKGVQVTYGLDKHLYQCFENTLAVIGICSTALFEALAFSIPVYYFHDAYGTESLEQLSEVYPIYSFENFEEVIRKIESGNKENIKFENIDYLFSSNSLTKIIDEIYAICEGR